MRMAGSGAIINIAEDASAVRRRRWRSFLRLGIPLLGIILVITAIISIAVFSHYANKRGVLALSDDLLNTLDAQIGQRVNAFLDPCERTLRIMRTIAATTPSTDQRALAERFAASVLGELPQIAAFYAGDGAGNFLMVRRRDGGGFATKTILNESNNRHVFLVEHDAKGEELSRQEDPTDTFDPRTRPWYEGALKDSDVFWTGIYVFFTGRQPGITVSSRVHDVDGTDKVFGVDITLQELSRFLGTLDIGTTGRALIIDQNGRLIAAPGSTALMEPGGDDLVPKRLDELSDPVLTAAYDRFRVEGNGRRLIEQDGVTYISSTTHLPGSGRDWWIMIVVPEEDFIGFVANNNRTALALSLVIVIAVMALAALLVRQGLRADRSVRLMTERASAIARESTAYAAISRQLAEAADETPPAMTETLTALTGALRASIWRLNAPAQLLTCTDSFDGDRQGHVAGFELHRRELPQFFELLETGREATILDAAGDKRSSQFHNIMMRALGSHALTVIPLSLQAQIVGAICLEDPRDLAAARDFLRTAAALALLSFEKAAPETTVVSDDAPARPVPRETALRRPLLSADLGLSPTDQAALKAQHFPAVAALSLRISGALAFAKGVGDGDAGTASWLAALMEDAATEYDIPYIKLVGQQVVAATGLEPGDDEAMTRIAGLAVAIREQFLQRFDVNTRDAEFRIGLGFGGGFGCVVGEARNQFNLWGEAIETADLMAQTAAPSAIQASEAAYAQLRQDFLFRPRGSFFIPGVGDSRTFVLAGQL